MTKKEKISYIINKFAEIKSLERSHFIKLTNGGKIPVYSCPLGNIEKKLNKNGVKFINDLYKLFL